MSCTAVSYCQSITAFVECIPQLYQGDDHHFEIQLIGQNGLPLDLTLYSGIYVRLYTDGFNYYNFSWPHASGTELLEIIQTEDTNGPVDEGIIAFNVTSEMTSRFLTGSIFAEIKFRQDSETTGSLPVYKTIGCLNLGYVRESLTRDLNDF
jgi:hypothetical protein